MYHGLWVISDSTPSFIAGYSYHGNLVSSMSALLKQVAVKTLPFYKKYFNIAYPLPKIDLIALADFAAGTLQ